MRSVPSAEELPLIHRKCTSHYEFGGIFFASSPRISLISPIFHATFNSISHPRSPAGAMKATRRIGWAVVAGLMLMIPARGHESPKDNGLPPPRRQPVPVPGLRDCNPPAARLQPPTPHVPTTRPARKRPVEPGFIHPEAGTTRPSIIPNPLEPRRALQGILTFMARRATQVGDVPFVALARKGEAGRAPSPPSNQCRKNNFPAIHRVLCHGRFSGRALSRCSW